MNGDAARVHREDEHLAADLGVISVERPRRERRGLKLRRIRPYCDICQKKQLVDTSRASNVWRAMRS